MAPQMHRVLFPGEGGCLSILDRYFAGFVQKASSARMYLRRPQEGLLSTARCAPGVVMHQTGFNRAPAARFGAKLQQEGANSAS